MKDLSIEDLKTLSDILYSIASEKQKQFSNFNLGSKENIISFRSYLQGQSSAISEELISKITDN